MKRNLLSLLSFFTAVLFSCTSNSGNKETSATDSSVTWTVNDSTSVSTEADTSQMIRFNCFDIPEEKADQLGQVLYLSYEKYLGDAGRGVLKHYLTYRIFDTTPIEKYVDRSHLKQRYFFYVYNRLPQFVDQKERHSGYYLDASKSIEEEDRLVPYVIYRFDRSPENIRRTFDIMKNELRAYISPEMYEALAINKTLHSLRDTYQYIRKLENADARLDSVYMAVDSVAQNYDYDASTAYGHSLDSDYGIYQKYLSIDKYQDSHPESYETLWAFSFWVRRHHEKNEGEVSTILGELVEIFER